MIKLLSGLPKPAPLGSITVNGSVLRDKALAINPLSPSIKLQILLLCFHTFLTEVVGRSCLNINRI